MAESRNPLNFGHAYGFGAEIGSKVSFCRFRFRLSKVRPSYNSLLT